MEGLKSSNVKEADATKAGERENTQPQDDVRSEISTFSSVTSKPPASMPVLAKVGSKWCCARTTDNARLQGSTIRCN